MGRCAVADETTAERIARNVARIVAKLRGYGKKAYERKFPVTALDQEAFRRAVEKRERKKRTRAANARAQRRGQS